MQKTAITALLATACTLPAYATIMQPPDFEVWLNFGKGTIEIQDLRQEPPTTLLPKQEIVEGTNFFENVLDGQTSWTSNGGVVTISGSALHDVCQKEKYGYCKKWDTQRNPAPITVNGAGMGSSKPIGLGIDGPADPRYKPEREIDSFTDEFLSFLFNPAQGHVQLLGFGAALLGKNDQVELTWNDGQDSELFSRADGTGDKKHLLFDTSMLDIFDSWVFSAERKYGHDWSHGDYHYSPWLDGFNWLNALHHGDKTGDYALKSIHLGFNYLPDDDPDNLLGILGTPVPEPGSLALFALGGLSLLGSRRRKQDQ